MAIAFYSDGHLLGQGQRTSMLGYVNVLSTGTLIIKAEFSWPPIVCQAELLIFSYITCNYSNNLVSV